MYLKNFRFLVICFLLLTASKMQAQIGNNQAPAVKLIKPGAAEQLKWNVLLPYEIQVADAEDGNSAYEEIAGREVILLVKYLKDPSLEKAYMAGIDQDLAPLIAMSKSTCLNCHAADTKLIGPSFDLIAKKYGASENAKAYLSAKVITGSAGGVWGAEKMPPNPDMSKEAIALIVAWILKQNDDPAPFYVGLEGAIRTPVAPTGSDKGIFILTGAYEDHGLMADRKDRKLGLQTIVMKMRY